MSICENSTEVWVKIIEISNISLNTLFLVAFGYRLYSLRNLSTTQKHINQYPHARIFLSFVYALISFALLITYCVKQSIRDIQCLLFEGGVGECVNSIILVAHMIVLRVELRKQKPYTRLHLFYMIYLFIISTIRFCLTIVELIKENKPQRQSTEKILLGLEIVLFFISGFMFLLWLRRRRQLPVFIDLNQYEGQGLQKFSRMLSLGHIDYQRLDSHIHKQEDRKIFITVRTERGNIRIILQAYTPNEILKSQAFHLQNFQSLDSYRPVSSTATTKGKHKQIISDKVYTIKQIKKIYTQCNRFDLQTKLNFKNFNMGHFYRTLDKYLNQLFSNRKSYTPQILQLFHIDKEDIKEIVNHTKRQNPGEELQFIEYIDKNALFLSVNIFKQFWNEDHYIFYMNIKTMCGKHSRIVHKRFSDFQDFHKILQKNLNEHQNYRLPNLPKKHLFKWAEDYKITERRKQLQIYCRQIGNDFYMMNNIPSAKQLVLSFFGFNDLFTCSPQLKNHEYFYQGIEIKKGKIMQALMGEQYVTFYQFIILKNGVISHTIIRRFRQFVNLHENLHRWMKNIQISYQFLILPDKFLFKSQAQRHEDLKKYLHNMLLIKEIYVVYSATSFLNLGRSSGDHISDHGLSVIKNNSSGIKLQQASLSMESNQIGSPSIRSNNFNGRISQLIEDLEVD